MKQKFTRRTLIAASIAGGAAAGGCAARGRDSFGSEPEGDRLTRCMKSPNWSGGRFHNLEPAVNLPVKSGGMLRGLMEFFFEPRDGRRPSRPVPSTKSELARLPQDSLVWLGHSGFFINAAGLRILVDPALDNSFPWQFPGILAPFPGAGIFRERDIPQVDVLLLTHDHYDHLEEAVARAIEPRTGRVVAPLGVGCHLEGWGWPSCKITELDWFESTALSGGSTTTCLPSQHFSGRLLTKRDYTLWGGFMLSLAGFNLYISGDGGYGGHFKRIASMWPEIDLAIVEDGQYNEAWSGIHLLPEAWRRAVADLRPQSVMPCHNSKYCLSPHVWTEPLRAAKRNAEELGIPLVCPMIGEATKLSERLSHSAPWWPETP